jgi:hypothetical protein
VGEALVAGEGSSRGEGFGSECGGARGQRVAVRVNSGKAERLPSEQPSAGIGSQGQALTGWVTSGVGVSSRRLGSDRRRVEVRRER